MFTRVSGVLRDPLEVELQAALYSWKMTVSKGQPEVLRQTSEILPRIMLYKQSRETGWEP